MKNPISLYPEAPKASPIVNFFLVDPTGVLAKKRSQAGGGGFVRFEFRDPSHYTNEAEGIAGRVVEMSEES
jgi:hypothetical protein